MSEELYRDKHELDEIKLKKLNKKLEISNQEFDQIAYISSHDLKEPIRMITSFLQLLKKRYENELDEDAEDFINFAVEGAKRLDKMINDLLKYYEVGSKDLEQKYISSEKVLEQVLYLLNGTIKDRHAVISHDLLPVIYANEQQMITLSRILSLME